MEEKFDPRNELERKLMAAQEGTLPGEEFMQDLMSEQVFMPVKDQDKIANFQRSDKAVPLTVQIDEEHTVLIIFTSPERGKTLLQEYKDYEGGLLVEFSWVLERIEPGYGVILNPGWSVGMDLDAETIQQLKQQNASAAS